MQSDLEIIALLLTEKYLDQWRTLIESRNERTAVWIAEKQWMEENTGQRLNQACVAFAKLPQSAILKDLRSLVVLDGIDHAVNVGSIVRNCAAFGATGLIVDHATIHPYSWRAVRTSLGSIFDVPVVNSSSLSETVDELRNQVQLIAADPKGSVPISEIDFSKNCCFIFGNEHQGLSQNILNLDPMRVAIPVSGKVDSVNVAAACAIFLYQKSLTLSRDDNDGKSGKMRKRSFHF